MPDVEFTPTVWVHQILYYSENKVYSKISLSSYLPLLPIAFFLFWSKNITAAHEFIIILQSAYIMYQCVCVYLYR